MKCYEEKDEQMKKMERICRGEAEKKPKKKTQQQMFVTIGNKMKGNKKIKTKKSYR